MISIFRFLVCLLFASACTPTHTDSPTGTDNPTNEQTDKGMATAPADAATTAETNEPAPVKGIKLEFSDSRKNGAFYEMSDLKIIEAKTGNTIDTFPEFTWGPVTVQSKDNVLTWQRSSERGSELSVIYSVGKNGDVVKRGTCSMPNDPDAQKHYLNTLPKPNDKNANWETTVSQLLQLAKHGNVEAYEFFMAPSPEQKKYEKFSDGAASFKPAREVLQFMKDAGCVWDIKKL